MGNPAYRSRARYCLSPRVPTLVCRSQFHRQGRPEGERDGTAVRCSARNQTSHGGRIAMMKITRTNKTWVFTLLIWGSPIFAGTSEPLLLAPESALWLVGDSTLHPFTCRTSEFQLTAEVDRTAGRLNAEALLEGALKQMQLTI